MEQYPGNKAPPRQCSGADISLKYPDNQTALHIACVYGNTEAARILLVHGTSIHKKDCRGRTPVDVASTCGYTELVYMLQHSNSASFSDDSQGMSSTAYSFDSDQNSHGKLPIRLSNPVLEFPEVEDKDVIMLDFGPDYST